jgi:hypothetical protein
VQERGSQQPEGPRTSSKAQPAPAPTATQRQPHATSPGSSQAGCAPHWGYRGSTQLLGAGHSLEE